MPKKTIESVLTEALRKLNRHLRKFEPKDPNSFKLQPSFANLPEGMYQARIGFGQPGTEVGYDEPFLLIQKFLDPLVRVYLHGSLPRETCPLPQAREWLLAMGRMEGAGRIITDALQSAGFPVQ